MNRNQLSEFLSSLLWSSHVFVKVLQYVLQHLLGTGIKFLYLPADCWSWFQPRTPQEEDKWHEWRINTAADKKFNVCLQRFDIRTLFPPEAEHFSVSAVLHNKCEHELLQMQSDRDGTKGRREADRCTSVCVYQQSVCVRYPHHTHTDTHHHRLPISL